MPEYSGFAMPLLISACVFPPAGSSRPPALLSSPRRRTFPRSVSPSENPASASLLPGSPGTPPFSVKSDLRIPVEAGGSSAAYRTRYQTRYRNVTRKLFFQAVTYSLPGRYSAVTQEYFDHNKQFIRQFQGFFYLSQTEPAFQRKNHLSDKVGRYSCLLLNGQRYTRSRACFFQFQKPGHVPAKIPHSLQPLSVLSDFFRRISMNHIPVTGSDDRHLLMGKILIHLVQCRCGTGTSG